VSAYEAEYRTKDDVVRFFDDVVTRLAAMPDVESAGAGSSLPLSGQFAGTSVVAEGRPMLPATRPQAGWQFITPGYLAAVGMRIRAGRDFSAADVSRAAHVTIINEQLAQLLFPGEDPIGRRIGIGGTDAQGDWHDIIGVVADVRHQALDVAPAPRVYDLFGQHWGRTLYVVARSRGDSPAPLINVVRRHVADLNPNVPVFEAATLQLLVDRSAAARRLASIAAASLAGAGLLLALVGVYAITAAVVVERTREIGVRAALGATPRDLFRLVAGDGARSVAWGVAAGVAGSVAVARVLGSQLFDVTQADAAATTVGVVLGVVVATALAAIPPGWRAAVSDPLAAMRSD
jgi:predicted permease